MSYKLQIACIRKISNKEKIYFYMSHSQGWWYNKKLVEPKVHFALCVIQMQMNQFLLSFLKTLRKKVIVARKVYMHKNNLKSFPALTLWSFMLAVSVAVIW